MTNEEREANYATHRTRTSDSSIFDEVCLDCGAQEYAIGRDELCERPCGAVRYTVPRVAVAGDITSCAL